MDKAGRFRVYEDRLWDAEGREWSTILGQWAIADEVATRLAADSVVVIHGHQRASGHSMRRRPACSGLRPGTTSKCRVRVERFLMLTARLTPIIFGVAGRERLLAFVEFC